jgi:hypothetical protein
MCLSEQLKHTVHCPTTYLPTHPPRVWHLSSGQLRASLPTGHEGAVHCLAITSATGTQQHQQVVVVVVTGSEDMTLRWVIKPGIR